MAEQNLLYLFIAFAVIWVVLFAYIFLLQQKVADLRQEVKNLVAQTGSSPRADRSD